MLRRISLKRRRFSASISFERKSQESVLKWLPLSSTSFLPVFIASSPSNESDLLRRASSAEILPPRHLSNVLETATLPRKNSGRKMMPPPGALDGYELETQTDAFPATLLWEKIVIHLERTVKCGRRTQGLRTFDDCFLGSKAVDCLTAYLNTILPKTIKRSQVRVLCQRLQLTGVIEDVRSNEKTVFREGRLYRFTGNHFWHANDLDGQGGIPRSLSAEHIMKECRPATADPSMHSKGYTSDSTLGPPSIVVGSGHRMARPLVSCKPSAIKGPQLLNQCHSAMQNRTLGKSTAAVSKSIQAVNWTGVTSKQTFLEKSTRKMEGISSGGKLSRKHTFFQRDKHKQPASPSKEPSSRLSSKDLEKRYSLQMRESKKAKERDFAMSSYRNEVRQRVIMMNRSSGMHRSHSFSSDTSSASGDASRKWVVYGFV